ncbi:proline-rich protein 18 [Paroedura picta]|uniref:proline-rich protein 18 n=1 Tax=Paroedura picta TaxID=143630 RepID=UPI004056D428
MLYCSLCWYSSHPRMLSRPGQHKSFKGCSKRKLLTAFGSVLPESPAEKFLSGVSPTGGGTLPGRPPRSPLLSPCRALGSSSRLRTAAVAVCLVQPQRHGQCSPRSPTRRRSGQQTPIRKGRGGGGEPCLPAARERCRAERHKEGAAASRAMSLPPIAPPPAAAPRLLTRKQSQSPPTAAPRRAPVTAAALAPAKPPRKGRGAPAERCGAFSSSWPSTCLQKQVPRSRAAQGSSRAPGPPQAAAGAAAAPVLGLPPSPARGRSDLALPGSGTQSCESLGAAQGGRGEAALRFSLSLPPEATRVLQRRSLEKQQQRQRVRTPRHASPDATKRLLAAGANAGGDLRALLKVSLLNERHRYDDVEYEEEAPPSAAGACTVDEGLVRKCTEWLRGVESAAARDQGNKLDTLPHLRTL